MPRPGLLAILTGPNQGRTFFIPLYETVSIGSAFDAWASLPHDLRLSGHHCTIRYDGEYFHLTDLNSQQGTLVYGINIATIGSVPLPVGECFTAGDSTLQVRLWPPEVLRTLSEQSEPLLAVIDASRDESIWPLLNRSKAYYSCLFEGTRAQSLAAWAPYLVSLSPSSALLKSLVQAGWGKHWGVYLTSLAPFETILAHLRQWLWVQTAAGEKLYFRFYDPKSLRVFLPTLTLAEQQRFFGSVRRWLVEADSEGEVLEYVPESGIWPGRNLARPGEGELFTIRSVQLKQFEIAVNTRFKEQAYQLLYKHLSRPSGKELELPWLRSFIEVGINHAERYGLTTNWQIIQFLLVRLKWGANFDQRYIWAKKVLSDPHLTAIFKMSQLIATAKQKVIK
ncbi:MAG: DUF4123 domain-containing protein [Thioploca sp.]|nr:DUF4123 domain-containing protein [Thioploca sp.]